MEMTKEDTHLNSGVTDGKMAKQEDPGPPLTKVVT